MEELKDYVMAEMLWDPSLDPDHTGKAQQLEGEIPSPLNPPKGCKFNTRCPAAMDDCRKISPALEDANGAAHVACLRWKELAGL